MSLIDQLCLDIDGGDDEALLFLADVLEEEGDPRVEGLRTVILMGYRPFQPYHTHPACGWRGIYRYCLQLPWHFGPGRGDVPAADIGEEWDDVYQRLERVPGRIEIGYCGLYWPTRSTAYLALAEALSTEVPCHSPN